MEKDTKNLTVITTHINADFDAMASMLAAQKLYPDALVVFPGSQEKNLRNFFIKSMVYLFNMADIKDINFPALKRLVLVDTRQAGRIGKLSSILECQDVEIHIYDHHPPMDNDIKGDVEFLRLTGATVTILTEIIKEKRIPVSPDEATIMCLGIYEDTGSFTFSSTTENDFNAAAFLLSKGANLNIVSNLISREISTEQISLLNDMIQATRRFNINGVEIVTTSVSIDHYVTDFAFLVHKMVKMENLDAIFAIARMEDKIYIVARSRIPEVDVGKILTPLGGGGHTFAAAVTVKGKTLAQIEHQLSEIFSEKIRAQNLAKDLMSSPAITVNADTTCKEAADLLIRYNVNALLVTEPAKDRKKLLGYITRQVVEKVLFHKLEHIPVREYMTTEIVTVHPGSNLSEIQEKIIEYKQRVLPVIDHGDITGVITRTDLLNIIAGRSKEINKKSLDVLQKPGHPRTRNIRKFMKERLSKKIIDMLESIGEKAFETGCNAYVVGGFVRDLFLYRSNEDIDIVIEGDGISFAKKYAKTVNARVHSYEKFGTAVITFPGGFKIDVASARMEYYKFPAALPTVEMSSIKLDLFRRDFTVNTLSIQLNPGKFGTLIDFFAAMKDIKGKSIRVLHNLSFVEDPTRVFRAIRFEQRFGFSIGKLTSGLIGNAVKMNFFKRLSGRRVFSELRQILEEKNPTAAIMRLDEYNLLQVIHPSIKLSKELVHLFNSVKKVLVWHDLLFLDDPYMKWAVYFSALVGHCNRETTDEICKKIEIPSRYRALFVDDRFDADRCLLWMANNLPVQNSTIYHHLSVFKTEIVLYMMAATGYESVKRAISNYFTHLRNIKVSIRGRDLINIGLEPGPVFREILKAVLDARLNNQVKTYNDEIDFVKNYVRHNKY